MVNTIELGRIRDEMLLQLQEIRVLVAALEGRLQDAADIVLDGPDVGDEVRFRAEDIAGRLTDAILNALS